MRVAANLFLLIISLALVNFFTNIELEKQAYLDSLEGTYIMADVCAPSPLAVCSLAVGFAGIGVFIWALRKDYGERIEKYNLKLSVYQGSPNMTFRSGLLLVNSLFLIALSYEVDAERRFDVAFLKGNGLVDNNICPGLLVLFSGLLGCLGSIASIWLLWKIWVPPVGPSNNGSL